ncbi:MAG: hypothetical protein AAGC54_02500 [Cyanobacteria bacterium P01_F01_bin.4]
MTTENIKVNPRQGQVVIANRASGDLSILNEDTGAVIGTVDLPTGEDNTPGEPMYVSSLNTRDEIHLSEALIGPNAKPHDVILDPSGRYAYVTISQANNPTADLLLKISTQTFDVAELIRLHGSADLYELGSLQGDTTIFYKAAGQAAELIGVVQNVTGLDLTSTAFEYATV